MKWHQVGPELQARWSPQVDGSQWQACLSVLDHFCDSLLSFPMCIKAVGAFQTVLCHYCVGQQCAGSKLAMSPETQELISTETNAMLHHAALPQQSHVWLPNVVLPPLDKPCTPFTGLGPQKQALGFSHQAPMLISKSFTNWIYVFWGFLPSFILVCFITASLSSSLVEMVFYPH